MSELIDLRSDTVTRPTPEMRKAMAEAEVGDDVLGDDPTVIDLQERAAALLGKEAALFVPSGSMGNQVCLGALAPAGSEVLCHEAAHFLHFEGGAAAAHLGLMMRPLRGERGVISHQDVRSALRAGSEHTPRTAVVAIENTHNSAGGRIFPLEEARAVAAVCGEQGVPVHLDGARLFNAQAATGIPAREWADCADTLSFCFSKGLGAPIGSMVCSTREVVAEAHRLRKRLGGGMRQAGVIAAAAKVALESGVERLAEDHANARRLAEGLADLNPGCVDPKEVETNMVYVDLSPFAKSATEVRDAALEQGVLTLAFPGSTSVRLVTHRDVSRDDTERALEIFKRVL
jgi:threonine aldolase